MCVHMKTPKPQWELHSVVQSRIDIVSIHKYLFTETCSYSIPTGLSLNLKWHTWLSAFGFLLTIMSGLSHVFSSFRIQTPICYFQISYCGWFFLLPLCLYIHLSLGAKRLSLLELGNSNNAPFKF